MSVVLWIRHTCDRCPWEAFAVSSVKWLRLGRTLRWLEGWSIRLTEKLVYTACMTKLCSRKRSSRSIFGPCCLWTLEILFSLSCVPSELLSFNTIAPLIFKSIYQKKHRIVPFRDIVNSVPKFHNTSPANIHTALTVKSKLYTKPLKDLLCTDSARGKQ